MTWRITMKRMTVWTLALLLAPVAIATADDAAEDMAMARVRLSTEAFVAKGCTRLGAVSDDKVKDLRKKIVRAGGDTGILTFSTDHMSTILADVYRCPPKTAAPTPKISPPPPVSKPPTPRPPSTPSK
jgi:hypothetical protein